MENCIKSWFMELADCLNLEKCDCVFLIYMYGKRIAKKRITVQQDYTLCAK